MLCASDVDVSKQRIYFAIKTETASELRSLRLSSSEDFFDSSVERRVDDEFMNGLFACRPITLLLLPRRVRSTAISVFVCMSVCLYLFARISQTACPKFRKFFLHTSGFAVSAVSATFAPSALDPSTTWASSGLLVCARFSRRRCCCSYLRMMQRLQRRHCNNSSGVNS